MPTQENQRKIQEILFKFMRSFDDKDFALMQSCMCDEVYLDYSTFRKTPPGKQKSRQYCEERQKSLATLITQHNLFNIIMENDAVNLMAKVNCNFVIYRFTKSPSGSKEDFFHSYGQYEFELRFEEQNWKISSITQKILMNEGNPDIHKGILK